MDDNEDHMIVPEDLIVDNIDMLITFVWGTTPQDTPGTRDKAGCAILAPHNKTVDLINEQVLMMLSSAATVEQTGEHTYTYYSSDNLLDNDCKSSVCHDDNVFVFFRHALRAR